MVDVLAEALAGGVATLPQGDRVDQALVLSVDTPEGGGTWRAISDHLPVLVEFR